MAPIGASGARPVGRVLAVRALVVFVVLSLGVLYGFAAGRRRFFPYSMIRGLYAPDTEIPAAEGDTPGRWRPARDRGRELTGEESEEASRLATLGYLRGVKPAGVHEGVTLYDPERAYGGLNLFTSGHGPEALLMNMSGEVLHTWRCDFSRVWPDWDEAQGATGAEHWGFARLCDNGDLLAIFNWFGLIKLDRDSNLLWSHAGRSHHDLFVTRDGSIYTLDTEHRMMPEINEEDPVADNFITVLSSDGEVLRRISILEAFRRSDYAPMLDHVGSHRDVLHTNTIEVFDGRLEHRSPAFKEGNVLLSFRELDAIAVVDMEAEEVVWALWGGWRRQHQPTILPNGRMLLFDNLAGEGASEVVEFDPFTQEIFWSYGGDAATGFFTEACGRNQRLPNGNTLITESDSGRAFEVTPDKIVIWEYVNPHRAGAENELIATIPVMVRLSPALPLDWLEAGGS